MLYFLYFISKAAFQQNISKKKALGILTFESNILSSFIGTVKLFHKAHTSFPDCFINAGVTQHL